MYATYQLSAKGHKVNNPFDAQTFENLVTTLQAVWSSLHAAGRYTKISQEGRYKIHQVLGSMDSIWSVMQITEIDKFKNADEARALLGQMLAESGAGRNFTRELSVLLSRIASRRDACTELGDKIAAKVLDEAFWALIRTGAFSSFTNTFGNPLLPDAALQRFVLELRNLWDMVEEFSLDSKLNGTVRALVARTAGLGIFEGVREQNSGRFGNEHEDLVAWYDEPVMRRQRGFFATVGQGLHDLGLLTQELESELANVRGHRKAAALKQALELLKDGTVGIVKTGVLNLMSA